MASVELARVRTITAEEEQTDHLPERVVSHSTLQLEPADRGWAAWKVLLAAFVFEGVLWGFPLSYGVFLQYYSNLPEFRGSSIITYVGTFATGITYLGAPLMAPLVKRFAQHQRLMVWIGWVICLTSLIAGSFATSIAALVLTQGILYGIGYLIIFYPIVNMVNSWFIETRGRAWGIMLGSSGISGVVYPFIIETLLQNYGYATALRAMAVATFVLTGPLIFFLRDRLPATRTVILRKTDWSFAGNWLFWLFMLSTVFQSLGFYMPTLFLPAYASAAGFSAQTGALLIALINSASVGGQLIYGYLSDRRFPLKVLLLSTSVVAAVSSLTLWGLAQSLTFLILFALIYGFFAYAYLAMRVRIGTAVSTEPSDAMMVFSIFSFGQGIGNVLAGPISGVLLGTDLDIHEYGFERYKALVIFTGISMFASAACISLSYLAPSRLRA